MNRTVYTKDVKFLLDSLKDRVSKNNHYSNTKGVYDKMHRYMDDVLIELRSSHFKNKPSKNITPIPSNTLIAYLKKVNDETTGDDFKGNLGLCLDPLCWVIEGRPFLDRFRMYPNEKDEVKQSNTLTQFARFPISNPSFPATSAQRLKFDSTKFPDLKDYKKIFMKDESQNPTGTHKDRMALEVLNWYESKQNNNSDGPTQNPVLSLLSYGCAAMAIQTILGINSKIQKYSYSKTNLRVLVPDTINIDIEQALKNIGCEVFKEDLTKGELNSEEILKLTKNTYNSSYDLTFGKSFGGKEKMNLKNDYYSYMAWEIINSNAKYIFLPFGSGDLYYNVLKRMYDNLSLSISDDIPKCMHINPNQLNKIALIGSTVFSNPSKKESEVTKTFDKLYSPYYGENKNQELCKEIFDYDFLHPKCSIQHLQEKHLKLIPLAIKTMEENKIDFEMSGLSSFLMFLSMKDELEIKPNDKVLIVNTGRLKYEQFL